MWEQDQTNLPNKSLTGNFPTPALMFSGRASFVSGARNVANPNHDIIMTSEPIRLSRRQKTAGPLHHLWNNHGTWWFHGTFHLPDGTAKRQRVNLKTSVITEALSKRERLLSRLPV